MGGMPSGLASALVCAKECVNTQICMGLCGRVFVYGGFSVPGLCICGHLSLHVSGLSVASSVDRNVSTWGWVPVCTKYAMTVSVSNRQVLGWPPGWLWRAGRGLGLLGAYGLCLGGIFIWDS